MNDYHQKPSPIRLNEGAKNCDIAGLKKVEKRSLIPMEDGYRSEYTIGFEVEKNSLHRNAVKEYELFCGFEYDRSCGYEAVTHILPLLPASGWRTKVFDMMYKAEKIIDDQYSPSNNSCGGHITVGVEGHTGNEIREKMAKNCGIIFALFRKRLKNNYCMYNLRLQSSAACNHFNGFHHKYQAALTKSSCLEFRLPSRVQSVKQMMRRYELFYEVVDFSIKSPNASHEKLLKRVYPIVLSMYNGDTAKADEMIDLAREFRKFILKGEISDKIREFIR